MNDDRGWDLLTVLAVVVGLSILIFVVDMTTRKDDGSNQRIKQELDSKRIVEFEK